MFFPRHQIPLFRGYAHCANTEGTASKQFPRATDQHPTGEEKQPNSTPHKQNISPAIPLTRNLQLAPPPRSAVTSPRKRNDIAKEAQWVCQGSDVSLQNRPNDLVKEAASLYEISQMTLPRKLRHFTNAAKWLHQRSEQSFQNKPSEISVCSLWMHISRLWMAISKLCTAIQSLQTKISALGRGNKSQSQRMKNTYLCKPSGQFFLQSGIIVIHEAFTRL